MYTRSLKSLLVEKFPTFPARWIDADRETHPQIIAVVKNYLKDVFEGHTIVQMDRRADLNSCGVKLQLDITAKLRDGSLLTDIICDLGYYDIHCPEDGVELIKKFDLSKDFDGLAWRWLDLDSDADAMETTTQSYPPSFRFFYHERL